MSQAGHERSASGMTIDKAVLNIGGKLFIPRNEVVNMESACQAGPTWFSGPPG